MIGRYGSCCKGRLIVITEAAAPYFCVKKRKTLLPWCASFGVFGWFLAFFGIFRPFIFRFHRVFGWFLTFLGFTRPFIFRFHRFFGWFLTFLGFTRPFIFRFHRFFGWFLAFLGIFRPFALRRSQSQNIQVLEVSENASHL